MRRAAGALLLVQFILQALAQEGWGAPAVLGEFRLSGTEGYLILTRNLFSEALGDFANWKRKMGYSVTVVTLESILERYPGRDIPEKMRNCILDYYENHSVRWILLVGDADNDDGPRDNSFPNYVLDKDWELPTRYVWNPDGTPNETEQTGLSDNWTPTDLYYAGLDGDWENSSGENKFRFPDWGAEVYVGRWPVRTVEEVRAIAEKTMNYRIPSNNFVVVGARLSTNSMGIDDEGVVWTMENVRRLAMKNGLSVHPLYDLSPTCYSVSLSRSGNLLAAGTGQSGRFYLFENSDNTPRLIFNAENEVVAVALAKDENFSVAGTSTGDLFFFENFDNSPRWVKRTGTPIVNIRISADGQRVAVLLENGIILLDGWGDTLWTYENSELRSLDLSENGELLAAGAEGWVGLWQTSENTPRWVYRDSGSFTVSLSTTGRVVAGDENRILMFGSSDNQILWSHRLNGRLLSLETGGGYLVATSGEPDNKLLYFGENENVPLWAVQFQCPPSLSAISGNGKIVATYVLLVPPANQVRSARTFILDNENRPLGTWTVEWVDGTRASGKIYDLALPENGNLLAAGGFENIALLRPDATAIWSFDPQVFPSITFETFLNSVNELSPVYITSYSHGSTDRIYYWGGLGWGLRPFEDKSTESLFTADCFLQVSFACFSAAFDIGTDSLGENLLKAPARGAVIYIGGNRAMWVTEDAGGIRELLTDFWENFFTDPLYPYHPGRALYGAIASFSRHGYDLTEEGWRKNLLCLSLLGDPELPIPPDWTPPSLLNIAVSVGHYSATITWRTDEKAWGTLEVANRCYQIPLGTEHRVEITGLSSNTTYTYTITVRDRAGNPSFYRGSFTTLNRSPSASFNFSPLQPRENENILFTDTSHDPDGAIVSWLWDFGDGTSSSARNPTHAYKVEGVYTVSLTVWDERGASSSTSRRVEVLPLNFPPRALFSFFPPDPNIRDEIHFDGSGSSDEDGYLVSYLWDFGDNCTGEGPTATHRYAQPGVYLVELIVRDNGGKTAAYRENLVVSLPPPAPSVVELENLPPENALWRLLRSEPSSAARTLGLMPVRNRAEIIRLGMSQLQKMLEVTRNMDPGKLGEALTLIPPQALTLLSALLENDPPFCARILLAGPLNLLENFRNPEVLGLLRHTGAELPRALSVLPPARIGELIRELVLQENFGMIEDLLAALPEKEAREVWSCLPTETRQLISPHLSPEVRGKLEREFPFTILLGAILLFLLLAVGVKMMRKRKPPTLRTSSFRRPPA